MSAKGKSVHFISLGCPKNRIDTEAMLGALEARGYRHVDDPAEAGAVVVNTCGFLRAAAEESLDELRRLSAGKPKQGYRLVAAGCLAQMMGAGIRREVPGVDSVIGINGCGKIAAAAERETCHVPAKSSHYPNGYYLGRRLTTGPGWAWLRIADGCDNRCSYCLIPSIRGRFRSRRIEDIVREAEALIARGVKELNLIAQDTTNYGADLYGRRSLGRLVKKLDRVDGIEWVRLLYTHPAHWDERLMGDLLECRHVVNYIDLPLQHCSDRILKSMGRGVTRKGIESLIAKLRGISPGTILRTTMMVGYPGETDAEFDELLAFAREQRFDRLGAFAYSAEPGTRAARLPGQVPEAVKARRLRELMAAQKRISLSRQQRRVGKAAEVLIEGACGADPGIRAPKGYGYCGRSRGEAPEVDGKVFLKSDRRHVPGEIVMVKLEKGWAHDYGGSLIGDGVVVF